MLESRFYLCLNDNNSYLRIQDETISQIQVVDNTKQISIICNTRDLSMLVMVKDLQNNTENTIEQVQFKDFDIIDLSVEGNRWEGSTLRNQPFGFGSFYDCNGYLIYKGFYYQNSYVCYGISYYGDLGEIEFVGSFFHGKRHGYGELYDRNKQLVYAGYWLNDNPINMNNRVINSSNINQFSTFTIEDIIIDSIKEDNLFFEYCPFLKSIHFTEKTKNSFNQILFHNCPELTTIVIDDQSLIGKQASIFQVTLCHQLQSISIGNNTLTNLRCFQISDCEFLQSISFGMYSISFQSTYSSMILKNLPSLTCFTTTELPINQLEQTLHECRIVLFENIPNLEVLQLNDGFYSVQQFYINNASLLEQYPYFLNTASQFDIFDSSLCDNLRCYHILQQPKADLLQIPDLSMCQNLEYIFINSCNNSHYTSFSIHNCNKLKLIRFGSSLYPCYFSNVNTYLEIVDCPVLQSIIMGNKRFANFSLFIFRSSLHLDMNYIIDLPSLTSLYIGDNIVSESREQLLILKDLPSLSVLSIGKCEHKPIVYINNIGCSFPLKRKDYSRLFVYPQGNRLYLVDNDDYYCLHPWIEPSRRFLISCYIYKLLSLIYGNPRPYATLSGDYDYYFFHYQKKHSHENISLNRFYYLFYDSLMDDLVKAKIISFDNQL